MQSKKSLNNIVQNENRTMCRLDLSLSFSNFVHFSHPLSHTYFFLLLSVLFANIFLRSYVCIYKAFKQFSTSNYIYIYSIFLIRSNSRQLNFAFCLIGCCCCLYFLFLFRYLISLHFSIYFYMPPPTIFSFQYK